MTTAPGKSACTTFTRAASDVLDHLGLKARAWAWLIRARAYHLHKPGYGEGFRLGPKLRTV